MEFEYGGILFSLMKLASSDLVCLALKNLKKFVYFSSKVFPSKDF